MHFWVRFIGDAASVLLSILLVPSIHLLPGHGALSVTLTVIVIALILTVVNSLPLPLMEIFPYWFFLACFGIFALMVNSLLLSMTVGFSTVIALPFVLDTPVKAIGVGALTTIVATAIMAHYANSYRD